MFQQTHPASYRVISSHSFAEVREETLSLAKSLHSRKSFHKGDVLCHFGAAAILKKPTYLTVQTGITEHIHLKPGFLSFTNHSCSPNVFFDTFTMQLVCTKDIKPGDELVFFYPSTEWDMAQPFECLCGSSECLKFIRGAAHMDETVLDRYRLSAFILEQLQLRKKVV